MTVQPPGKLAWEGFLKPGRFEKDDLAVYHYTDFAGLLGILSSRQLWLSDVRYQNDTAEVVTFLETAKKASKLLRELRDLDTSPVLEALDQGWEYWVFTSSFSRSRSLLSQWRAYASKGGVAIGFCKNQLKAAASASSVSMHQCEYEQSEKNKLVAEALDQAISSQAFLDWKSQKRNQTEAANELRSGFLAFAARSKRHEFIEEREVRLIRRVEHILDGIEFRNRGSRLVPYWPLDLDSEPIDPSRNRLGICEIVVWPGESKEFTAVSMLASKHQLSCVVSSSGSSHRID